MPHNQSLQSLSDDEDSSHPIAIATTTGHVLRSKIVIVTASVAASQHGLIIFEPPVPPNSCIVCSCHESYNEDCIAFFEAGMICAVSDEGPLLIIDEGKAIFRICFNLPKSSEGPFRMPQLLTMIVYRLFLRV